MTGISNKASKVLVNEKKNPTGMSRAIGNKSAQIILGFMMEKKIKGNFRDHVLFVGNRMHDYSGEYEVDRPATDNKDPAFVVLLHKRNLHLVVGDERAEFFWSKRLRKRNPSPAYREGWSLSNEQNST